MVRNPVFPIVSKFPNKWKLEAAVTGEVNLISIIYHLCAMHLHFKQEATGDAVVLNTDYDSDAEIDLPTIYDNTN